jgi:hypothetical protein
MLHSFPVQHSAQKLFSHDFGANCIDRDDWLVLWERNLDLWVLGKVHWAADRSVFYNLVFEKIHKRV